MALRVLPIVWTVESTRFIRSHGQNVCCFIAVWQSPLVCVLQALPMDLAKMISEIDDGHRVLHPQSQPTTYIVWYYTFASLHIFTSRLIAVRKLFIIKFVASFVPYAAGSLEFHRDACHCFIQRSERIQYDTHHKLLNAPLQRKRSAS